MAQENKKTGIYFGAVVGSKLNRFNDHFITDVDPSLYSFSIGAGSAWTKNNYIIDFGFVYSSGNQKNRRGELQYIGFSNTLSFGHTLFKHETWKIEPNLGVVLNNNQLLIQNNLTNTFQNLVNNQLAANMGLNIRLVGKNGLFTGLKMGYILPFAGSTTWKNKASDQSTGLKDHLGTFYLQLNFGGLLTLNPRK